MYYLSFQKRIFHFPAFVVARMFYDEASITPRSEDASSCDQKRLLMEYYKKRKPCSVQVFLPGRASPVTALCEAPGTKALTCQPRGGSGPGKIRKVEHM